jgi:transcription antitermination factor NusG
MPLLRKEPDAFPDDLFQLPVESFPWMVVHVRSRQEKLMARHLHQRSFPFFLPQIDQKRKRSGRVFTSFLPLFPGYVFVRGGADAREAVRRSNVAVNVIDVIDQERLGGQLADIRRLQLAGASLRPHEEFVAGDPVLIKDGAFSGYSGIVVRERGRDRLLISIALLRQSVAVEFDREIISRARPGKDLLASR